MSSQLSTIYEFGRFRLDRRNRRLTRDGLLQPIPESTLQILIMLVEKPDQIVFTERLVDRFFARSNFAEEELTAKILELRRVLEDTSKEDPMVRWLPGKGYRFEAPVTEYLGDPENDHLGSGSHDKAESDDVAALHKQNPLSLGKTLGRMLGIAVAAILLTTLALWGWRFMHARSAKAADGSRQVPAVAGSSQVAVLPIRSMSGSVEDERFDSALTAAVIDALARRSPVPVVPVASVVGYTKSAPVDQLAAGRELGARVIVVAVAQPLAGRVRVRVQMVRTEDEVQIWTGDFDGDTKDVAGLAAEISEKIGKQIHTSEAEKVSQ